mmetsp:Transcript_5817/g.17188  ORF Transcript_5817/g.17188 Transcript_5817/m.17188 type:complete len:172 (+) Transcript_5817:214-729(+)
MAKSIRSKVKKRHRTYMRKTVGEKVRSANISAAAARMQAKQRGRPNTKTLSFIKGALGGAGQVDLGKAYYEAVVRPARTAEPPSDDDDDDMSDEDPAPAPAPAAPAATLEEERATQLALATKQQTQAARLKLGRRGNGKKVAGGGSGMFAKRARRKATVASSRPPKEMVAF